MPNVYERAPGKRTYRNLTDETLKNALSDVQNKKLPMRQASKNEREKIAEEEITSEKNTNMEKNDIDMKTKKTDAEKNKTDMKTKKTDAEKKKSGAKKRNKKEIVTVYDYENTIKKFKKNEPNEKTIEAQLNKIKPDEIKVDDFIKAQFETIKGNFEEYIGQVSEINRTEYNCRFLRKNIQMTGFYCFPFVIDESIVKFNEILKKMTVIQERRGNYRFD